MSSLILNYLFQLTNFLTTLISIITNILLIICTILFIVLVAGLIYFYVNKEKYFLLNLLLKQCDTPPISSYNSSLSSLFDQINCFNLSNFANKNRIEEKEYIDSLVPKQEFLYKETLDEFFKKNCNDGVDDYQNLDVGVKIKKIV